jgi:hypothetical protein
LFFCILIKLRQKSNIHGLNRCKGGITCIFSPLTANDSGKNAFFGGQTLPGLVYFVVIVYKII